MNLERAVRVTSSRVRREDRCSICSFLSRRPCHVALQPQDLAKVAACVRALGPFEKGMSVVARIESQFGDLSLPKFGVGPARIVLLCRLNREIILESRSDPLRR
jgi:hypothetical protein